jgi:hypothetical protein
LFGSHDRGQIIGMADNQIKPATHDIGTLFPVFAAHSGKAACAAAIAACASDSAKLGTVASTARVDGFTTSNFVCACTTRH